MDYQRILIRFIFFIFTVNFISGCDTDVSPEPLRITGTPPTLLFYDAPFEYTFGATGGDGVYRYRYIQNPDIDDNAELTENPVEMNIEVIDGAKPSFKLRAVPKVPTDVNFDGLTTQKHRYQIELTDGVNTVTETYEFTLNKNKLTFVNPSPATEGSVSNQSAKNLQAQLDGPSASRICKGLSENTYEKYLTTSGYAYPHVFQVSADEVVASKTKLYYRFVTNYSDTEPERAKRNVKFARPDVDYLNEERSIELAPGEITCIAYIDLLDDIAIEDEETVTIEFYKHEGGAIDYLAARYSIDIKDNEVRPVYNTQKIVRNVGDKVIVPITLSRPVDYPININVSADSEATTATESDYKIEPTSGVITIAPGEIEASYSVSLLNNESVTGSNYIDKIISIVTDVDDILEVEPYSIEINEWTHPTTIEHEIIGSSSDNEEIVDFISDGDGVITALIKSNSGANSVAKLRSYNRNATPTDFSTTGQLELSKTGINVVAKSIVNNIISTANSMAVILNVDGLFADVYRGKSDFVVAKFQKERDEVFSLVSVKQYGTDGDDIVTSATLKNNILYVYGKTDGTDFEGLPTTETNFGGEDGFIYAIDLANNTHIWSRFLGTSNQDNVVSVDVGNREIVAALSTTNTDEDVLIKRILTSSGSDIEGVGTILVSSLSDDVPVSIRFDSNTSNYRLLVDSDAQLDTEDQFTPSLSRDVQLIPFNSENEKGSLLSFASDQDDRAVSFEKMPNGLNSIVSGNTYGSLAENVKNGVQGTDAFVSIIDTENLNNLKVLSNIQFGTSQSDHLLSVKPVSNTKFFVLWSEGFTEPGQTVYRLTPFSIDGKKLSSDPE